MPIIRDLATVRIVLRGIAGEARAALANPIRDRDAIVDYVLAEIDQLADLIQPGQPDTRPGGQADRPAAGQQDTTADTRTADTRTDSEGGAR